MAQTATEKPSIVDLVRTSVRARSLPATAGAVLFLALVLLEPYMTFNDDVSTGDQGSALRQVLYLLALALVGVSALRSGRRQALLEIPVPILIALGWCWLSMVWSIAPGIGVRRIFLTTLTIWILCISTGVLGYRDIIRIVRVLLVAMLVINFGTVLIDPATGVHPGGQGIDPMYSTVAGNWRGLMAHKNFAGAASALCLLAFLFDAKQIALPVRIAVMVASAGFLWGSQSKTSAGVLVIAMAAGAVMNFTPRKYRASLFWTVVFGGLIATVLRSVYKDVIASLMLNPRAFTGRGQIWQMLLNYSADHPLLGAGFGSFWNIGDQSPVYTYARGYVTFVTIGHNGYLDLLASIGIPGLALVVFAMVGWPLVSLLTNTAITPARGALLAALLVFCIGHNATESSIFDRDSMVGVMLALAVVLIARQPRAQALDPRLLAMTGARLDGDAGELFPPPRRRRSSSEN